MLRCCGNMCFRLRCVSARHSVHTPHQKLLTFSSASSRHFDPSLSVSHSITYFTSQFLRKMWPIQLGFLLFTVSKTFLSSLTVCNTSSFFTRSIQLIFSILYTLNTTIYRYYVNDIYHNHHPLLLPRLPLHQLHKPNQSVVDLQVFHNSCLSLARAWAVPT